MSKRMSKMDLHNIREMAKEGMSQKDIAYVMETNQSTISRVLTGERGEQIDRLADRTEYFLGGISTGCYENGEEMGEFIDPTFESVAFEEEMEQFLEELDDNVK